MSDLRVEVDTHGVNVMFNQLNLTNKEARSAIQSAYRASANVIKKQAQANMRAAKPRIQKWVPYVNVTVYKDTQGFRVDALGVYKSGKGMTEAEKKVDAKYTSYKMRFFNWGNVNPRKTRRGRNRGMIQADRFMANAIESKKGEAASSLEANIFKYINKVVARRK